MNTTPRLPARLEEPVPTETEAHGFNETAAYLLVLVLQDDPRLPALTAGAMVTRVRELPIGGDLVTLDVILRCLETRKPSELTTSERRVTAMLLHDLISQALALLTGITQPRRLANETTCLEIVDFLHQIDPLWMLLVETGALSPVEWVLPGEDWTVFLFERAPLRNRCRPHWWWR